jgi:hypothetical protein
MGGAVHGFTSAASGNSMYWYSRAGKAGQFDLDAREELQVIRRELAGE